MASLSDSDTQLNQHSYYEASVHRAAPGRPLTGSRSADVVVIGAGFAGLSSAIELAERGYRVVVLEASRICASASGRNGGQAIVGYASGQEPFEQQLGPAGARQAWDLSLEAIDLLDRRIAKHQIACDRVHGYLYVADSPRKARALLADMESLQAQYSFPCEVRTGAEVQGHIGSRRYLASAYERRSGHLHPLKYGLGLAQAAQALGVEIYEHSPAVGLQRGAQPIVRTPEGSVQASFVVLAGNCLLPEVGPAVAPEIAGRIMPVGTYMVGTQPLAADLCQRLIPSNAAVCDNNFVLDYFRFSADHRMLFGGRVSYSTRTPAALKGIMARRMAQVFPDLAGVRIDHVWGGFVDISRNRAPDFGRLGSNIFYLQGFSGHGVALTGLAGQLVAEAIAGQAERFDVFARLQHQRFPGGRLLRTPSLVLGMMYYRLKDLV